MDKGPRVLLCWLLHHYGVAYCNFLMIKRRKSMSLIWMMLVGLVVGALAKLVMPGKDPGGIFMTMVIGVAGALVAGFLGRGLGWYTEGQPVGFVAALLGSILLLGLYRLVRREA
jgi:uncharacterized membrane protein YeaQ/YmgE (transglycosylase-associated protein family)